jgi:hypothetical protein
MTKTRLNAEKKNELGTLLLSGVTPTKAAESLEISLSHAVSLRKKLVKTGMVQPLRVRKKAKNVRRNRTSSTETMVKNQSTKKDFIEFKVNGVDFIVENPSRVVVTDGLVDINY